MFITVGPLSVYSLWSHEIITFGQTSAYHYPNSLLATRILFTLRTVSA